MCFVHRHDLPRWASVAAGDARPDAGFAESSRRICQESPRTVLDGGLGRSHFRRGDAVSVRKPVETFGGPARSHAEHAAANAVSRLQRGGLLGLSRQPDREIRGAIVEIRHRRVPHFRLAELDRRHENKHPGRPRTHRRALRGSDLLHGRYARPEKALEIQPPVLPRFSPATRRRRSASAVHQRHGRAAETISG